MSLMALLLNALHEETDRVAVDDAPLMKINIAIVSIRMDDNSNTGAMGGIDEELVSVVNNHVVKWRKVEKLTTIQSIKAQITEIETVMSELAEDVAHVRGSRSNRSANLAGVSKLVSEDPPVVEQRQEIGSSADSSQLDNVLFEETVTNFEGLQPIIPESDEDIEANNNESPANVPDNSVLGVGQEFPEDGDESAPAAYVEDPTSTSLRKSVQFQGEAEPSANDVSTESSPRLLPTRHDAEDESIDRRLGGNKSRLNQPAQAQHDPLSQSVVSEIMRSYEDESDVEQLAYRTYSVSRQV
jgi:hypothetical protein